MTATINQITATVEAANEKGIKFNGEWINFSKFAAPDAIEVASRGDVVALEIDGSGFVRRLQIVKADLSTVASLPDEDAPSNEDAAADAMEAEGLRGLSQRDVLIIRQSTLKAAAEFAASRPELKSADVLKISECWERWVTR
jgi:hypothetical protein